MDHLKAKFRIFESLTKFFSLSWKLSFGNSSFLLIVIIPMIIAAIYFFLIASPRYASSATLALSEKAKPKASSSYPANFNLLFSDKQKNSPKLLMDYIGSTNMLEALDKEMGLLSKYQHKDIDWFSRLGPHPNQRKALSYYQKMLQVEYNPDTGVVKITAQAFTPGEAHEIVCHVLMLARQHFVSLEKKLEKKDARAELVQLNQAKRDLYKAELDIFKYQQKHGDLGPRVTNKVEANTSNKSYSEKDVDYLAKLQQLKVIADIAKQRYTTSLTQYENAQPHLTISAMPFAVLEKPLIPDFAEYPRTTYILLSLFFILLILYGTGRMIITIIKEHRY